MKITDTFIYNIKERPSKYSFLVAIPFNMYRIQTYKYADGLNFFQRVVLKFMAKPGISIEMISSIMDVDRRLVEIVVKQLKEKKYIDADNLLTDEGRLYRNSAMGIVVDPTEKKVGYVFQMCDRDEYYPFYVNGINVVQSYVNQEKQIGIIFEAEEKERDFRSSLFVFDTENDQDKLPPSDLQVLQLMENGCKASGELNESLSNSYRKCDQLKMEFLPNDTPESVYVCTYVYLESLGNNIYDKEWKVVDPFREGVESPGLKFYLQSLNNRLFSSLLIERFKSALTQGHASWNESEGDMAKEADKLLSADFDIIPSIEVDPNDRFNSITRTIVEYFLKNKASGYKRDDISHMIILYTQRLVELVFEIDSKERVSLYRSIENSWFTEPKVDKLTGRTILNRFGKPLRKPKNLNGDSNFCNEVISALDWLIPNHKDETYRRLKAMAERFDNKDGIYKRIFTLLLCWTIDNDDKLLKVLTHHLGFVLDKCSNRNVSSHGTLRNDKLLSEDDSNEYYEFVKQFVKDYAAYRKQK